MAERERQTEIERQTETDRGTDTQTDRERQIERRETEAAITETAKEQCVVG